MHSESILLHLKKHGQLLDSEIAAKTGIALPDVRLTLTDLAALDNFLPITVGGDGRLTNCDRLARRANPQGGSPTPTTY